METYADIPVYTFKNSTLWRKWLDQNYTDHVGVWIKIAKKDAGIPSITHTEALDEALCYGWIDGMRRGYDDRYFLQKFTPRRKRSLWSKVNIGKVEALISSGRMHEAGHAEITLAKQDGRWDAAYESQANATPPDDLVLALDQNLAAKEFYESLTKAEKYSVLWKLMTAKTATTRASRLAAMIASLAAQKKI